MLQINISNSANNPQKDEVQPRHDTVKMLVLAIQFSKTKEHNKPHPTGCGKLEFS